MASLHSLIARSDVSSYSCSRAKTRTAAAILLILFAGNVYDPTGALRIKYVAFCLTALFSVWTLKHLDLSVREVAGGLLLLVVWPLWSLLYGVVQKGDVVIGLTEVTPFLFALPLVTVVRVAGEKRSLRLFYACMFSLAIVVVVSFRLFSLFPEGAISSRLFDLLSSLHEREGYFGVKSFGDTQIPRIYFGSTLFLVPTSVFYLFAGKVLRALVAFLALAFAFSKAGIVIVLAFGLVSLVSALFSFRASGTTDWPRTRWSFYLRASLPFLLLVGLTCSVLLAFPSFSEELSDTVATESGSAQVRIAHFDSVVKLFVDNPHYLFVGQGVGVPFYTSGESEYVQNIEVDHVNTIRKFGLPWFIAFTVVVFYSSAKLIRSRDQEACACGFALISMYLAAGTNPVLLSPLCIMLMMLCYFAQRQMHARASKHPLSHIQRV